MSQEVIWRSGDRKRAHHFRERSGTSADATKGGSQQQQRLLLLLLCCAVYVFAAPPTEFIIRVSLTDF
jgi:hypothetical protein